MMGILLMIAAGVGMYRAAAMEEDMIPVLWGALTFGAWLALSFLLPSGLIFRLLNPFLAFALCFGAMTGLKMWRAR